MISICSKPKNPVRKPKPRATEVSGSIVRDAAASVIGNGGTTVIPVYIGQERIEEIVVRANRAVNYRSGGR